MEKIKGKMAQEVSKIEERKAKIDDELKEVQVRFVKVYKTLLLSTQAVRLLFVASCDCCSLAFSR